DRADPAEEPVHRRMRQLLASAEEMKDLAAAIGHRLPWWPRGCATPPLVAAWEPGTQLTETVPPPLADADAFRRRCAATADQLDGDLAASVRELGNARWGQASNPWRPGYTPDRGALPDECDDTVWQVAVRFDLSHERPAWHGDFWQGLEWLMEHAPSPRLARDARRIFGDPDSAATVLLDTAQLPDAVTPYLTTAVTPATASGNYRAQCVVDTLDAHPGGATGARLGTWPALAGPAWCATAPGTALIAFHVPRSVPAPGPETGGFLEAVLLRTATVEDHYAPGLAITLVVTDRDHLVVLPECGDAARLAAVIEHVVRHPGIPVHMVGLVPSANDRLIDTVESLLSAAPRSTPWEQLERLVGPHPSEAYCMYCPADDADAAKGEPGSGAAPSRPVPSTE
ncbi:hypothetical protein, partial [Streptomyces sp. NPDC057910]|uniref:hypothetical protein n=1 Tax=Streptomyces sp. NPDC057910 TaxID=3346278 RepID=UPI0036E07BE1